MRDSCNFKRATAFFLVGMDEQDMRSDEEDEEYEDIQDAEDEDVDDDEETAFDDVDYGLEEGDGEGEPSHRLANVFSCRF